MAVYNAAFCWEKAREICHVTRSENRDGFTAYIVEIHLTPHKWQVERRFKQFVELHEKMVKRFSINKNLLPPKKVFGNRSETFINERQQALEHYLQTLIHQFSLLPEPLAMFLDFHKYEIRTITARLSEALFTKGDEIITNEKSYEFSPMQLYAISERLKLGDPTCYSDNPQQDIGHLVEFITQLKHLKILGNSDYFEASNIIPNDLSFDLSMFKALDTLKISNCKLERNLLSVETLRPRLKSIVVHESVTDLSHLLLCEILHWFHLTDPVQNWPFWHSITYADFSHNSLVKIHPCIQLLSSVKHLDLSYNEIQVIENLETLSELSELNFSHNKIKDLESLHTRLGNIDSLNLSFNKIKSLHGLSKLFSISKLFLENNAITAMSEIAHLSRLPCLEVLNLQNNPVTFTVDYRPQLLLMFETLAPEIIFDGLKATEKEIDTVSVLQALKQARGEKGMTVQHNAVEGTSTGTSVCHNSFSFPAASQELSNIGENAATKGTSTLLDTSKFRQQVETLRKIGGSDWLRLLNEMHCLSYKATAEQSIHRNNCSSSNDIQFHNIYPLDKHSGQVTPHAIKTFTLSYEISFPDWLLFLDLNNSAFRHILLEAFSQIENVSDSKEISPSVSEDLSDAKILWAVILNYGENYAYETPICAVMLQTEVVFLKLKEFTTTGVPKETIHISKFYPVLLYERSIAPCDILSISLGTCDAYVELKVKANNKSETLIIVTTNKSSTNIFVNECQRLCHTKLSFKANPFVNKTFELENINTVASLTNISIEKQIIFCQRVCVSKAFHKSQFGVLHYVFVTPSHVILVEEKLLFPEILCLDANIQPQFQICALVSVHTNIKQVHLQDTDYETTELSSNGGLELTDTRDEAFLRNKELNILYKSGSWLIMEFESNVILYLNFFNLKFRNEFLNAFLCARSQK